MATLTARVEDWLDREVREFWEEHGVGPSSGLRHVVEEWWTLQRFPRLEFRDGVSGRRAGIRSGPDVWEVVLAARDHEEDRAALRDHFGGRVPEEALGEALEYAGLFPEAVESRIAENQRIERMLSGEGRR